MITVYAAIQKDPLRIKFAMDKDVLPTDVVIVREFVSSGDLLNKADVSERFWKFYGHARFIEQLSIPVCIDMGGYFYETGMHHPDIKE